jgi:hypothetical protein
MQTITGIPNKHTLQEGEVGLVYKDKKIICNILTVGSTTVTGQSFVVGTQAEIDAFKIAQELK